MRRDLDRREFLRRSSLLGGAAAAATLLPRGLLSLAKASGPSMLDIGAADSPISHVVVLMMENRSFDHYLGWLADDESFVETGLSKHGRRFNVMGDTSQSYTDPEGHSTQTYYLPEKPDEANPYRGCEHPDPGHGWDDGRAQRDGGFLAEDSGNDIYALGYYKEPDIPFYASLARRFTIFDRFHCSILGPTYPNREYLHSAQSGGYKDNSVDPNGGFAWATIWDRLAAASVPAAYYFVDLPVTALWGHRLLGITRHIEGFFEDCAAGTLPNVTFVDPGFTTGFRTDDHPFADIRSGQKYVRNIVKALEQRRAIYHLRRVGRVLRPRCAAVAARRSRER